MFVQILLSYFFLVCFYFLLDSKTKNWQRILFICSGTTKENGKEETQASFEEFTRFHRIIWWWLCVKDFLVCSFYLHEWYTLLLFKKCHVQKYLDSLEWVISGLLLLLAPVGSGFWQYFQDNSLIHHEKQT